MGDLTLFDYAGIPAETVTEVRAAAERNSRTNVGKCRASFPVSTIIGFAWSRSTRRPSMAKIVAFPQLRGVEITSGTVQSATITDEHGTRPDLTDVGKFFYYVDVIEVDGGRVSMWHGTDRERALEEAAILAKDFGGTIRDLTKAA